MYTLIISVNIYIYICSQNILSVLNTNCAYDFCTGLEFVSPSYRMVVGVVIQMFFSVGFLLTSAFAYIFTNWRYFQLAITMPTLCYTTYHWSVITSLFHHKSLQFMLFLVVILLRFIPESVRWLLANGKQDKAIEILHKVCQVNGVDMSSKDIANVLECDFEDKSVVHHSDNLPKASFFDLFKRPVILKRSVIIMLLW